MIKRILLSLFLFCASSFAATPTVGPGGTIDTATDFVPVLVTPIPNQSWTVNNPVNLNFGYYLKCTSVDGSSVGNPVYAMSATGGSTAGLTLNTTTGQLGGAPTTTGSPSIQVTCRNAKQPTPVPANVFVASIAGVPTNNIVKWHPGSYRTGTTIDGGGSSPPNGSDTPDSAFLAMANTNFKGVLIAYYWGALEWGTPGNFDFSRIRHDRDVAKSIGKQLMIQINTHEFSKSTFAPNWLLPPGIYDDPVNGWAPRCTPPTVCGVAAQLYKQSTMDRYIALWNALAAEFDNDPTVELMNTSEMAAFNNPPPGYTLGALRTQWYRWIDSQTGKWPHTTVMLAVNYFFNQTATRELIDYGITRRFGISGPDLAPYQHIWGQDVVSGWNNIASGGAGDGVRRSGMVPIAYQMQGPDMEGTCKSNQAGAPYSPYCWTIPNVYDYARDFMQQQYMIWSPDCFCGKPRPPAINFDLDVVPYVAANNPQLPSACPTKYNGQCGDLTSSAPILTVASSKYVDCSAASNGAGTQASPWNRLSSVTGMAASQDLWLKAGTNCNGNVLNISWSGTANDYTKVGSYYVSGGSAYELWPDNPAARPRNYTWSHGAPAIISGTYTAGCSIAKGAVAGSTCPFVGDAGNPTCTTPSTTSICNKAGAVPSSIYAALVPVTASYVKVQSIQIHNSSGRGLVIDTTPDLTNTIFDSIIAGGSVANGNAMTGIGLLKNITTATVRNSDIRYNSMAARNGCDNRFGGYDSSAVDAAIGSAVIIQDLTVPGGRRFKPSYHLWEHNDIGWSCGESFDLIFRSHIVVRDNDIGESGSTDFYLTPAQNIIAEDNFFFGTDSVTTPIGSGRIGQGTITPASEDVGDQSQFASDYNILIRNNVMANSGLTGGQYPIWGSIDPPGPDTNFTISFQFIGNTVISGTGFSQLFDNAHIGTIEVANNVFDLMPADYCDYQNATDPSFHHNTWNVLQTSTKCRGTGDIIGASGVTTAVAWAGFGSGDTGAITVPTDFRLGATSTSKGSAVAMTTPLSAEILDQHPDWKDGAVYPCTAVDFTVLSLDYNCQPRAGILNRGALNATQ